jgi:hypothetical protein
MKEKWYPRPHNRQIQFTMSLRNSFAKNTTIIPQIMYDEGMTSPSSYKSNPVNPSFTETDGPNVYPESYITDFRAGLQFALTKEFHQTDKIQNMVMYFMPIFTAFKEDLTPIDEVSTLDIEDILELQHEDTDRQTYPLWNGQTLSTTFTNSSDCGADVPGLTGEALEAVTFDQEVFYDALRYYTNAGKLKTVQGGLHKVILTKDKPIKNYKIHLRSATKRANEYMFSGVLIHVPQAGSFYQPVQLGSVTADTDHVVVTHYQRYYEWNDSFNTERA